MLYRIPSTSFNRSRARPTKPGRKSRRGRPRGACEGIHGKRRRGNALWGGIIPMLFFHCWGPALGGPVSGSQAPSSPHPLDADILVRTGLERPHREGNLVRAQYHLTDPGIGMSAPSDRLLYCCAEFCSPDILQPQMGIFVGVSFFPLAQIT